MDLNCTWTILISLALVLCVNADWQPGNEQADKLKEVEEGEEEDDEFPMKITDEQKAQLMVLFDQVDVDKDGLIDLSEIVNWMTKALRATRQTHLKQAVGTVDANQDGAITWAEYLLSEHELTPEKLVEAKMKAEKAMIPDERLQAINEEVKRFSICDTDNDGALTYDQFDIFLHPRDSPSMRELETNSTLSMYDKDHSDTITFEEYMDSTSGQEDDRDFAEDEFKRLDINNDTVLDRHEIGEWVMPSNMNPIEIDSEDLVAGSDKDGDEKLTKAEVLANAYFWVVHEATNYGTPMSETSETDSTDDTKDAAKDAQDSSKSEEGPTDPKVDHSEL